MKGMGQIVTYSIRDEALHVEAMTKLFREFIQENLDIWTDEFKKELYNEDLVYSSVLFGMGFWIDDQGLFISAPEFRDGSLDIDNAIPVYDWENFSELTEHHISHLMHIVQMCTLKRDTQQIEYYAGVFGNA